MPSQNVLVEDYKNLQLQFAICDSCYWCATCFNCAPSRCPSCDSPLNLMLLERDGRQQRA